MKARHEIGERTGPIGCRGFFRLLVMLPFRVNELAIPSDRAVIFDPRLVIALCKAVANSTPERSRIR
jgi:hypothetical protein